MSTRSPSAGGGGGSGSGGGARRRGSHRGFHVPVASLKSTNSKSPKGQPTSDSTESVAAAAVAQANAGADRSADEPRRWKRRRRGRAGTPHRSPSLNNLSGRSPSTQLQPSGSTSSGVVCETDDEERWRKKRNPRIEESTNNNSLARASLKSAQHHLKPSDASSPPPPAPNSLLSPVSTVYVDSHVRWLCEDGQTSVKTLKDLLRMGTEHIGAEADTPLVGPAQPPPAGMTGIPHPQPATGACQEEAAVAAKSPMLSFTLDGVATPNTFATMGTSMIPGGAITALPPLPPALHVENFYAHLQNNFRPPPLGSAASGEEGTFDYYTNSLDYFYSKFTELAERAAVCLQQEPMMACVSAPVYVFGDIHGNFADLSYFLKNIICFNDIHLSPCNILCLGDYVDRGPFSLECVMLLFALKLEAPHKITLLRGNHEDRVVCGDRKTYGNDCFLAQCVDIFGGERGTSIFRAVTTAFRFLPLACEIIVPSAPNSSVLHRQQQQQQQVQATSFLPPSVVSLAEGGDVQTSVPGFSQHLPHAVGTNSWRRHTDQRRQTHTERILCAHGGIPRFNGPPKEKDSLAFLRSPNFPRLLTLFPNNPAVKSDPELVAAATGGPALTDDETLRAWYVVFDLLWSDPTTDDTPMSSINEWGFATNSRGSNVVTFSQKAVESFLSAYKYSMLIRAHQEKAHGIRLSKSQKVLTVFSSSNYLGHGNGAGCVVVTQFGDVHLLVKSSR